MITGTIIAVLVVAMAVGGVVLAETRHERDSAEERAEHLADQLLAAHDERDRAIADRDRVLAWVTNVAIPIQVEIRCADDADRAS